MSLLSLPVWRTDGPIAPTFAQRVDELVGERIDNVINDLDQFDPAVLLALGFSAAFQIGHIAELFIARPVVGVLRAAVGR